MDLKKLWQEVRNASGIAWFRPYDTRHTGATRMAESGVPPEIIMRRLGHASDRMRQHYTHIFEQAQRMWPRGSHTSEPSVARRENAPPRFAPQSERPFVVSHSPGHVNCIACELQRQLITIARSTNKCR